MFELQCYLEGALTRRGAEHVNTRQARDKSVIETSKLLQRYSATVPGKLFQTVKYTYIIKYNIKFSFDFSLTEFLTVAL